jgi:hypothetical protein
MATTKTIHKTKFDLSKALLAGAALFQAYQFGRALHVYDPAGWHLDGVNLGGLILGVIVNVVVALASTRIPSLTGKNRIRSAWAGFFILLLLSPSLIAPAMWLILQPIPIGNWRIFLAIGLSIAPDLAIALSGLIGGRSLIHLRSDAVQTGNLPKSVALPKGAKKSVALPKGASVYPRTCLHCEAVISAPQAVGAHMKKHHPELCKVSPSQTFEAMVNKK